MRIAIVDDSEEMLDMIYSCVMECVGNEGCEGNTFITPVKVLEEINNNHEYDLYLLDVEMEPINGIELAKKFVNVSEVHISYLSPHMKSMRWKAMISE